MALYGIADDKTSTGTLEVYANGSVTGDGTLFQAEAVVGDFIVANDGHYRITSIASNTACVVVRADPGTVVNAVAAANNYTLNEKPKFVNNDATGTAIADVYGVDTTEVGITDTTHAGWVRKIAKTDQHGNSRVSWEVLVAGSSIASDAADDTPLPDYTITITSGPVANSGSSSGNDQPEFSVATATEPAGGNVTFTWQYTTEVGNTESYATTVAVAGFSGQTSNTLIVDANTIADATQVRCVVGGSGVGTTITSDDALLTVTA